MRLVHYMRLIVLILIIQSTNTYGQANYRLMAYSNYVDGADRIIDSMHFTYSDGREGKLLSGNLAKDFDSLRFDTCEYFQFKTNDTGRQRRVLEYNTNGKLKSNFLWTQYANWELSQTSVYDYDANNNLTFELKQIGNIFLGGMQNNSRTYYKYDRADRLIIDSTQGWGYGQNGAYWEPAGVGRRMYDANGDIIFLEYENSSKQYYSYSNSRLLTSRTIELYHADKNYWYWNEKDSFSYNPSGKIEKAFTYHWDTTCSCWSLSSINNLTYTIDEYLHTVELIANHGQGLRPQIKDSFDRSSNGNLKNYFSFWWSPTNNSYLSIPTSWIRYDGYTMDNQLLRKSIMDVSSGSVERTEFFYYEEYKQPNHPEQPDSNTQYHFDDLIVYPSPTSHSVTVSINIDAELKFTIIDAVGKLCTQWTDKSNGKYLKTVPISNFSNGLYFLTLHTNRNQVTKSFIVTK